MITVLPIQAYLKMHRNVQVISLKLIWIFDMLQSLADIWTLEMYFHQKHSPQEM